MDMIDLEVHSFQLILHSGNARSLAYEALSSVKKQEVMQGKDMMKNAHAELLVAQKQHAQLLRQMANDENHTVDLLLIHAEDHVASSQVVVELINEIIQMYERFGEMK